MVVTRPITISESSIEEDDEDIYEVLHEDVQKEVRGVIHSLVEAVSEMEVKENFGTDGKNSYMFIHSYTGRSLLKFRDHPLSPLEMSTSME